MGCSAISLKKEGWGNVKGTVEYRSPVCKARICRKSPLMFQHPSFILARRNNRHHFRVSSRVMPMPPGYTKVFGFAPTWCTRKRLAAKAGRFSYVDLYWENRHLVSGLPFLVYTSEYSISGLRMCLQNGGSAVS